MKFYLHLPEAKLIRDSLYKFKNDVESGLKEKNNGKDTVEILNESVANADRLLLYFNDQIMKEDN